MSTSRVVVVVGSSEFGTAWAPNSDDSERQCFTDNIDQSIQ